MYRIGEYGHDGTEKHSAAMEDEVENGKKGMLESIWGS
jgi:hypothetical protein